MVKADTTLLIVASAAHAPATGHRPPAAGAPRYRRRRSPLRHAHLGGSIENEIQQLRGVA